MKIRIKYCGGCNPRYNRVEIKKKLIEDFPEVEIDSTTDNDIDLVVVLSGCLVSCVNHSDLNGKEGKFIIRTKEDYPQLKTAISIILKKRK